MRDIGPGPYPGDPVGKCFDIALHAIEPRQFFGEPWDRQMAVALAQMAENA